MISHESIAAAKQHGIDVLVIALFELDALELDEDGDLVWTGDPLEAIEAYLEQCKAEATRP